MVRISPTLCDSIALIYKIKFSLNCFYIADDVKDTQLVLLNALLFSADWKIPFNITRTFSTPFFSERLRKEDPWKEVANVEMMTAVGLYPFSYNVALKSDVAELPYKVRSINLYTTTTMMT